MRGAARQLERAPASSFAALACVALALLPEAALAQLAYDRGAILSGELWRLWSAHFVHFSLAQALADALVLFSMGALAEPTCGTRRVVLALALGAPLISLGLLSLAPALVEYRGASGLGVMLGVAAGSLLWHASARWKAAIAVVAVASAAKTLCEASGTSFDATTLPDGVAVAWQAHALGALLGLLVVAARRASQLGCERNSDTAPWAEAPPAYPLARELNHATPSSPKTNVASVAGSGIAVGPTVAE